MGVEKYHEGFSVAVHESALGQPAAWKKPRLVFVNSMSDLFHRAVPGPFIERVFEVMNRFPRHTFQVLTKRLGRAVQLAGRLDWTPNIWFGVSVESRRWLGRLPLLKKTGAHVRYLSLEPLLEPLPVLELNGIDWVIAGGESGPGARPMAAEWVRATRDRCTRLGVPFFFQAVGWSIQEKDRSDARWPGLEPDAGEVVT